MDGRDGYFPSSPHPFHQTQYDDAGHTGYPHPSGYPSIPASSPAPFPPQPSPGFSHASPPATRSPLGFDTPSSVPHPFPAAIPQPSGSLSSALPTLVGGQIDISDLFDAAKILASELESLKVAKQKEYDAMFIGGCPSTEVMTQLGTSIEARYEPIITGKTQELQRLSVEETLIGCILQGIPVYSSPVVPSPVSQRVLEDYKKVFMSLARPYAKDASSPLQIIFFERSELHARANITAAEVDKKFAEQWRKSTEHLDRNLPAGTPAPVVNEAAMQAAIQMEVRKFQLQLQEELKQIQVRSQISQLNYRMLRAAINPDVEFWEVDSNGNRRRC